MARSRHSLASLSRALILSFVAACGGALDIVFDADGGIGVGGAAGAMFSDAAGQKDGIDARAPDATGRNDSGSPPGTGGAGGAGNGGSGGAVADGGPRSRFAAIRSSPSISRYCRA